MICELCKLEIKTQKERYVHVEDFEQEKLVKDIWCHLVCFNKSMNKNKEELEKLREQSEHLISLGMSKINQLNLMFPQKEKEFQIV